jgi:hypothetical protein
MNLIGERVISVSENYAIGKIVDVSQDNRITVRYDQEEKRYIYPDAFKHYLRFADPDLQRETELLLQEPTVQETPRTRRTERDIPVPPRPTIQPFWVERENACVSVWRRRQLDMYCTYGSAAQDIYLDCCRVFGWDRGRAGQFAQHTNLYDKHVTKEDYSVWFLPHHCWLKKERDRNRRWYNVVGREVIYEEWVDALLTESDRQNLQYDFSSRLTFAKDKNGKYCYIGVFKPIDTIENQLDPLGRLIHTKIYVRINRKMYYPEN